MENLIDSLQTSQDFLRRHSLCCRRWRDDSFIKSLDSRRAKWIASPVPRADDLDCLSYDWLAGMCFLRLRLMSMDARYERQEGSSSRNWWTKRWGADGQTPVPHGFPEECRKTRQPWSEFIPGYEDDGAVSPSRTGLERVRTDCVPRDRHLTALAEETL